MKLVADPASNHLLHVRLFSTTTTALTEIFLRELRQKHEVESAVFLVDGAQYLHTALARVGLRFQTEYNGNRNAIEWIFRERKRRTSSFSNCFGHVEPETAETWLQAFAFWLNAPTKHYRLELSYLYITRPHNSISCSTHCNDSDNSRGGAT